MKEELEKLSQEVTDVLMASALPDDVEPEILREAVMAYPARGGKALRPALLCWCCGLHGEVTPAVLKVAAAVELYHTWTLVHDDIIDNDDVRRGEASAHRLVAQWTAREYTGIDAGEAHRFGVNMAILAGDVQQGWCNQLVLQGIRDGLPMEVGLALLERLNGWVNPGLISGEALDVAMELEPFASLSTEGIERMLLGKTAVLLRFAAEAGGMLGLGTADHKQPEVRRLGRMAERAGIAFQLHDDLLGMFGDPAATGKPVGSDLAQGKRTLLFAEALKRLNPEDRECLLNLMGKPVSDSQIAMAQDMLESCGARAAITERASELAFEAAQLLKQADGDATYKALLEDWLIFVTARAY
jgi:geranylgeranyl diphosphate synthase type I